MIFFLTVLVAVATYCLTILYRRRRVLIYLKKCFNVPPEFPVLGHIPYFLRMLVMSDFSGLFRTISEFIKMNGKNIIINGPLYIQMIFITDPVDVEMLLSKSNPKLAKKSSEYDLLKPWLGTGLLTSDGEKWFDRRKIITPSFHFSILEEFVSVMNKQSEIFVKKLEPKLKEEYFNIFNYIALFALDVICEASMGITINAQSAPNSEYVSAVKEITIIIHKKICNIIQRWLGSDVLLPKGRRHNELVKTLHSFTTKVITKRRAQILSGSHCQKGYKMNFLDMLLFASIKGKQLSDEDIREEVDTFMFEGHDTITSGIAFTFYELSKHPDIQDRVYQEIKDIYENDSSTEMTYKKLSEMKYLEMVIKETLRLMPSVPFIARKLMEDVKIGNKMIPTGTDLIIAVYSMQRDPDNFPDPDKFDPERFHPANLLERHPFAYIPFSAGGRNCIGQRFAVLEMKTVISKVLMNFRLLANNADRNDPVLQADLILKPSNGIEIKLEKR